MSMSVQPVSMSSVRPVSEVKAVPFKGESNSMEMMAQSGIEAPKKERHWFKAAASAIFPGLGQILDGRFGTGLKQMLGIAVLSLVAKGLAIFGVASKAKYGLFASMIASAVAGLGALGIYINSIRDAFRGGKKAV